jgi:predicted outer membrane repeat protein
LQFDNSPYRITVYDIWLEGNTADDGAGLCVDRVYRDPEDVGGQEEYYQDTILELKNLVFTDNEASDDGGAVYVRAGDVDITNVVMDGNSGPGVAALAVKGSTVTLNNAIVSDNSGGPALYVEDTDDGAGSLGVTYSNLYDNSSVAVGLDDPRGSDGNIDDDPDFDTSAGDFSLQGSSPCVDAGDPALTDPDRSRSDMGAYGGPDAP